MIFYNKKQLEIFIIALQKNQKNIFNDKDIFLLKYKSTEFILASANYAIYNSLWAKLIDSINALPEPISNSEKWIEIVRELNNIPQQDKNFINTDGNSADFFNCDNRN